MTLILISTAVGAISWVTFPSSDSVDDVYYYPESGGQYKGNFADFMDILNVSIYDNDIVIKFQAGYPNNRTRILGYGGFHFLLMFIINDDLFEGYHIVYEGISIGYYFVKQYKFGKSMGGLSWNGIDWVVGPVASLSFSDINDTLILHTIGPALSHDGHILANTWFKIQSSYSRGEVISETEYIDYLPEPRESNVIPGYQTIIILFSIFAMISLISLYKLRKKINTNYAHIPILIKVE